MRVRGLWLAELSVLVSLTFRPLPAQEQTIVAQTSGSRFWQAGIGVLALNTLPWAYNWYIQKWPWADIGTRAWGQNLRHGFVWDDDCFLDNQLAHPYHGSLYLNSARASGYSYWGSLPFVAAGSATWELFFENVQPSLNDLVNTTLGGMALGEVTYRLSSRIRSRGTPRSALGRGLGAFALSPITQTQSLLSPRDPGAWTDSPEDAGWLAVGRKAERPFVLLEYHYGSPFDSASHPFDAFDLTLQVTPTSTDGGVDRLEISGLLLRRDLTRSERSQLVFGLYQHYDYHDLQSYEAGGQSMSGALLYRGKIGAHTELRLGTHVEALLLGAISSDYGHRWRRDYDYGPGLGARFSTSLRRNGRDLVRLDSRLLWLHSVYGAPANHLSTDIRVGSAIRLGRLAAIGGDVSLTIRHSSYRDFPSVTTRLPQSRAYLIWPPP